MQHVRHAVRVLLNTSRPLPKTSRCPTTPSTWSSVCFPFRDFQDKAQGLREIYRVLKPGGRLVICDAGKANKLHGFFGYLWMNSVVQVMARLITREKNHPWKGLAASYTHYGTNGYYRNMLRDVGFSNVQGRLLYPFGMASRFRGTKPEN